jgi:chemosensory pili system protein ChpA (sensor histidine kinase/response regulator)
MTERRSAVLVVEDEVLLQSTLSAFLTLNNFTTFRASDVEQAEKILGRERIDAVTLDIKLPDARGTKRNGFTLLKSLRATPAHAHLPVVIFTGMPMTEEEEALAKRLHAEVIYKPDPYRLVVEGLTRLLAPAV